MYGLSELISTIRSLSIVPLAFFESIDVGEGLEPCRMTFVAEVDGTAA